MIFVLKTTLMALAFGASCRRSATTYSAQVGAGPGHFDLPFRSHEV